MFCRQFINLHENVGYVVSIFLPNLLIFILDELVGECLDDDKAKFSIYIDCVKFS